nr:hypothetical protein HmN_001025500 [Hymenolepis microstoma]
MHCAAVYGVNENEIIIKNLSSDDNKMLNQRTTGTIFNLKTLSINKDEESGKENFNVIPPYLDNAQSIVDDECALSEDGRQNMLEKCQHQVFSRCKSVRGGGNALLRHLRAQVKAAKNSHSQINSDGARTSTQIEESPMPAIPKSRVLPAFFLNHFRRSPNRRVVRKVYTVSELVLKILNRRRSQTTVTSNNQCHFALSPQYFQSQTPAVAILSMPFENTQLSEVQVSEVTSSTTQIDKINEESVEVNKEDATSDKEFNFADVDVHLPQR